MEANSFACINTDGCKYILVNNIPEFGVEFHPGDPKTSKFAHCYVSVSHCQ